MRWPNAGYESPERVPEVSALGAGVKGAMATQGDAEEEVRLGGRVRIPGQSVRAWTG